MDSPLTHLIELGTFGIEIPPPGISSRRHCFSSTNINLEPFLQLSNPISCVMSKPSPIESIAFWAASKLETFGAITKFEGREQANKEKVEV